MDVKKFKTPLSILEEEVEAMANFKMFSLADFIRINTYSKTKFVNDTIEIARKVGFSDDPTKWNKPLVFRLLSIKLDHGEQAMLEEIRRLVTKGGNNGTNT